MLERSSQCAAGGQPPQADDPGRRGLSVAVVAYIERPSGFGRGHGRRGTAPPSPPQNCPLPKPLRPLESTKLSQKRAKNGLAKAIRPGRRPQPRVRKKGDKMSAGRPEQIRRSFAPLRMAASRRRGLTPLQSVVYLRLDGGGPNELILRVFERKRLRRGWPSGRPALPWRLAGDCGKAIINPHGIKSSGGGERRILEALS